MNGRGAFVVIGGPDGAGKTTIGHALREALESSAPSLRYHGRPPVLPRRSTSLGAAVVDPHRSAVYGPLLSVAKAVYVFLDFWLGWLLEIRGVVRSGGFVIVERGWFDLALDPRRYRLNVSPRLINALGRLLPSPHAVIVLDASAQVMHARKPELSIDEIDRQRAGWLAVAARLGDRAYVVDGAAAPPAIVAGVLSHLEQRGHATRTERSMLALECLGAASAGGQPVAVLRRHGRTRWLLPARVGGRGPWGAGLTRPSGARGSVAATALEAYHRSGAARLGSFIRVDPARGLGPAIERQLGVSGLELAASTVTKARGERVILSVQRRGRPIAFAKVTRDDIGALEREHNVLVALQAVDQDGFCSPRPLGFMQWRDAGVLLLAPLGVRARADRALGEAELAALVALAQLGRPLESVFGSPERLVPVHGDFAPWNSATPPAGPLVLWDWEEARLGLPLEDLFHWRTQRLVHFGHGSVRELVAGALEPDRQVGELCATLGVAPEAARVALAAYLRRGLADTRLVGKREPALAVRRAALALLEEAA
jgi:thymidylate kinase